MISCSLAVAYGGVELAAIERTFEKSQKAGLKEIQDSSRP